MKKIMNKIKREYFLLITLLLIFALIIFSPFIFFDRPFYLFGDQAIQYKQYYTELINLTKDFINGKGFPFYSWNAFLGSDFYSSNLITSSDMFIPILVLFEDINIALLFETIMCFILSGICMNVFLKEFGIKKVNVRIFISITYALCSWSNVFVGSYLFYRFFALFPLILFGVEKYINNKNYLFYIICFALVSSQSLYLSVPICFILVIYTIYTLLRRNIRLGEIIRYGVKFIGLSLLSYGIIAVLVVPFANYVILNPRVGDTVGEGLFWDIKVNIGFIFSYLTPFYPNFPNMFQHLPNFYDQFYSIFIGVIPVFVLPKMFINSKYKLESITLLVIAFVFIFRPTASIIHGFSEATLRSGFTLVVFALLCVGKYLDEEGIDFKVNISIFFVFIVILLITMFLVYWIFEFAIVEKHLVHVLFNLCVLLIIAYIFNRSKTIAIVLSITQLTLVFSLNLYQNAKEYYHYDDTINPKLMESMIAADTDLLFRYYVNPKHLLPSHDLNFNQSLVSGYMSTTSYHSLYDPAIFPFLNANGIYYHHLNLKDSNIMSMLGVKYYIVYDESELPSNIEFEYAYNLDHLKVYRNKEFNGFSNTFNKIDYYNNYKQLSDFNNTLFIDDNTINIETYKNLQVTKLNIYEKSNNYFKGDITLEQDNILLIPIPNNKGWKILDNGVEIESISVNGGFMGVELKRGAHNLEFYFMSVGFKEGLLISLVSSLGFIGLCFRKLKKFICGRNKV